MEYIYITEVQLKEFTTSFVQQLPQIYTGALGTVGCSRKKVFAGQGIDFSKINIANYVGSLGKYLVRRPYYRYMKEK